MPDQAHVEAAIVTAVASAVYPNGIGQPSIVGMPVRVYRGWPSAQDLNRDLKANTCHISVFPMAGQTRNTTTTIQRWRRKLSSNAAPTLAWTIGNGTATLTGVVFLPQVVVLIVGGTEHHYTIPQGATLASIVASIAAMIPGATAANATISMPSALVMEGRAGVPLSVYRETKRQRASFQISCWCPTPAARDLVAAEVDVVLSSTRRLALAGGYAALLLYEGGTTFDTGENANLYRRDLIYSGEWPTTAEDSVMPALVVSVTMSVGAPAP